MKQSLMSEETCEMLYQIMHANAPDASKGDDVFEDFHDVALFRYIVEKRGGMKAAKWVIFVSVPCDQFQTLNNISYDF